MDDLLVIILTIVIGIAGAFSQRKKRQVAANSSPQDNPQNAFWEIFQEEPIFRKTEVPQEAYEPWEPEPGPAVNEQNYTFAAQEEGGTITKPVVKEQAEERISAKQRLGFSLKKAVIYNEILNRKYV